MGRGQQRGYKEMRIRYSRKPGQNLGTSFPAVGPTASPDSVFGPRSFTRAPPPQLQCSFCLPSNWPRARCPTPRPPPTSHPFPPQPTPHHADANSPSTVCARSRALAPSATERTLHCPERAALPTTTYTPNHRADAKCSSSIRTLTPYILLSHAAPSFPPPTVWTQSARPA